MINYTPRLDQAIKTAAKAHEAIQHRRKGTDVPYIIHPFGVMAIASSVTDDEDTLIACLFHDILEDVTVKNPNIYNEARMRKEFGDRVTEIVLDVSKDETLKDWHDRSKAYLYHLENRASDEAVIVSGSDKVHNLLSVVEDYKVHGDEIWKIFTTKSKSDQLWWYKSIKEVLEKRKAPRELARRLQSLLSELV